MPPVSTRDPCEILGPSSARCNSTYFEIVMSECRTPATALASGRQGPAAQRQLATRPADPPQLHLGPARGRRRAQGLTRLAAHRGGRCPPAGPPRAVL